MTSLVVKLVPPSVFTKLVTLIKAHFIKFLIAGIPTALALWRPNHTFTSVSAQTVLVSGGFLLASLVHVVEIGVKNLKEYGLSKTALQKTYTEDEAWVKNNATAVRTAFSKTDAALDTIPGIPAIVAGLKSDVVDLRSRVPAIDITAIENVVRGYLDKDKKPAVAVAPFTPTATVLAETRQNESAVGDVAVPPHAPDGITTGV